MIGLDRTDTSLLGRWWWTVDRWTLLALFVLVIFGVVATMSASPPAAERLNFGAFHFVHRHVAYLLPSILLMIGISVLSPVAVRRLGFVCFAIFLLLLAATLVFGAEIKGARRWLSIAGLSLQPSEFVKPAFAVVSAWFLFLGRMRPRFPGFLLSSAMWSSVVGILVLQPNFGMTIVVSITWFAQLFVAGMPMLLVLVLGGFGVAGVGAGYFLLPHVRQRIDGFLDPSATDGYQVERGLAAFRSGGLFGRGPGEGTVKEVLPDGHSDFIFAVAGEEFGLIFCLILIALFAVIVLRGLWRLTRERDLFVVLAATGLLVQFGFQALVNMGVALRLLPTTGSTLPFISYGGSSLVALGIGMGMMLALTRWRPSVEIGR